MTGDKRHTDVQRYRAIARAIAIGEIACAARAISPKNTEVDYIQAYYEIEFILSRVCSQKSIGCHESEHKDVTRAEIEWPIALAMCDVSSKTVARR